MAKISKKLGLHFKLSKTVLCTRSQKLFSVLNEQGRSILRVKSAREKYFKCSSSKGDIF